MSNAFEITCSKCYRLLRLSTIPVNMRGDCPTCGNELDLKELLPEFYQEQIDSSDIQRAPDKFASLLKPADKPSTTVGGEALHEMPFPNLYEPSIEREVNKVTPSDVKKSKRKRKKRNHPETKELSNTFQKLIDKYAKLESKIDGIVSKDSGKRAASEEVLDKPELRPSYSSVDKIREAVTYNDSLRDALIRLENSQSEIRELANRFGNNTGSEVSFVRPTPYQQVGLNDENKEFQSSLIRELDAIHEKTQAQEEVTIELLKALQRDSQASVTVPPVSNPDGETLMRAEEVRLREEALAIDLQEVLQKRREIQKEEEKVNLEKRELEALKKELDAKLDELREIEAKISSEVKERELFRESFLNEKADLELLRSSIATQRQEIDLAQKEVTIKAKEAEEIHEFLSAKENDQLDAALRESLEELRFGNQSDISTAQTRIQLETTKLIQKQKLLLAKAAQLKSLEVQLEEKSLGIDQAKTALEQQKNALAMKNSELSDTFHNIEQVEQNIVSKQDEANMFQEEITQQKLLLDAEKQKTILESQDLEKKKNEFEVYKKQVESSLTNQKKRLEKQFKPVTKSTPVKEAASVESFSEEEEGVYNVIGASDSSPDSGASVRVNKFAPSSGEVAKKAPAYRRFDEAHSQSPMPVSMPAEHVEEEEKTTVEKVQLPNKNSSSISLDHSRVKVTDYSEKGMATLEPSKDFKQPPSVDILAKDKVEIKDTTITTETMQNDGFSNEKTPAKASQLNNHTEQGQDSVPFEPVNIEDPFEGVKRDTKKKPKVFWIAILLPALLIGLISSVSLVRRSTVANNQSIVAPEVKVAQSSLNGASDGLSESEISAPVSVVSEVPKASVVTDVSELETRTSLPVIEPPVVAKPQLVKAVPNIERLKRLEYRILSEEKLKQRKLFELVDLKKEEHLGMLPSFDL